MTRLKIAAAAIAVLSGVAAGTKDAHAVATYDSYAYGVLVVAAVSGSGTIEGATEDVDTGAPVSPFVGHCWNTGFPCLDPGPDYPPGEGFYGVEATAFGAVTSGNAGVQQRTRTIITVSAGPSGFSVDFDFYATLLGVADGGLGAGAAIVDGFVTVSDDSVTPLSFYEATAKAEDDFISGKSFEFAENGTPVASGAEAEYAFFPEVFGIVSLTLAPRETMDLILVVNASGRGAVDPANVEEIPLPASLPLLALGLGALGLAARRRGRG